MAIKLIDAGPNTVVLEPSDIPFKFVTPEKQYDEQSDDYFYQLAAHAINDIVNSERKWEWTGGESGTPYYDSENGCWYVSDPSFEEWYSPYYGSSSDTTLYFYVEGGMSVVLTLTGINDNGDDSYSYTMVDGDGYSYTCNGYPEAYDGYRDNDGLYVSLDFSVSPSTEIGTTFNGFAYSADEHVVELVKHIDDYSKLKFPSSAAGESHEFIVRIDMSELVPEEVPSIIFSGGTIEYGNPTFSNKLYYLRFREVSNGKFVYENMLLEAQLAEIINEI